MKNAVLYAFALLAALLFLAGCGSADVSYQLGIRNEQLEVSYTYSSQLSPKEWVDASVKAYHEVLKKLKEDPKYAQVKKVNLVMYLAGDSGRRPMAQYVIWLKHPRADTPNLLSNLKRLPDDYHRLRMASQQMDDAIRKYLLSKL